MNYKITLPMILIVLVTLLDQTDCNPVPGGSSKHEKIRIHVPEKHHTHFHTKTIIKTVHVPVPIKEHHHHEHQEPIKTHHHHFIDDDDALDHEDVWAKSYSQKKFKKAHPFLR